MTPAVLAAKAKGVQVGIHEYDHDPRAQSFGEEAADKLGVNPDAVFKTLVVETEQGVLGVGIVPVLQSLDLKAIAAALGSKKAKMADKQKVQRVTGYVVGGVSPLGQKKQLPTVIDASASDQDTIYVSGGKRGLDISLSTSELQMLCDARLAPIAR